MVDDNEGKSQSEELKEDGLHFMLNEKKGIKIFTNSTNIMQNYVKKDWSKDFPFASQPS